MKNYFVYKHTNLINNKVYIGITKQKPNRRWHNGLGYKNNKYFFSSIQKYGWKNFKHEILYKNLSFEEANIKEIELIEKYDSTNRNKGYNIHTGGDARKGQSMPKGYDSPKHKVVEQYDIDGNFIREYGGLRQIERETKYNHKTIQHCCVGECKSAYGYQWKYKDSNKIISKIELGHLHTSNEKLYHPVKNIETGEIFKSIKEAQEKYKIKNISRACREQKTAGGFHWLYLENALLD